MVMGNGLPTHIDCWHDNLYPQPDVTKCLPLFTWVLLLVIPVLEFFRVTISIPNTNYIFLHTLEYCCRYFRPRVSSYGSIKILLSPAKRLETSTQSQCPSSTMNMSLPDILRYRASTLTCERLLSTQSRYLITHESVTWRDFLSQSSFKSLIFPANGTFTSVSFPNQKQIFLLRSSFKSLLSAHVIRSHCPITIMNRVSEIFSFTGLLQEFTFPCQRLSSILSHLPNTIMYLSLGNIFRHRTP